MARWQPDAQGRLMAAALELYADRGFEQTTAVDIAERAGVTERTFFRYFTDKREVLFAGSERLQEAVVRGIAEAPDSLSPVDAVAAGMEHASVVLHDRRDSAARRAAVVSGNPSLHERELLKMAALSAAASTALRTRGVREPAATLAAESGVVIFKVAFEQWIDAGATGDFAASIRATLAEFRATAAIP